MPYSWYREFLGAGLNLLSGLSGGEFHFETPDEKHERLLATIQHFREQGLLKNG